MKNAILLLSLLLLGISPLRAVIFYVNDDATGANNGTSWADAYTDLQSAIGLSVVGDQIWVAAGTYKPTTTTNQYYSFDLKSGVALYGGFNGTETQLSQRDWVNNVTTLSGEIGSLVNVSDNCWNVVTTFNCANNTRLDGFRVIGGYADGIQQDSGGGIYNKDGSPTIANCAILTNYAEYGGGGVFQDGTGILTLLNCNIEYNNADSWGGGVAIRTGTLIARGCKVSNNHCNSSGGGFGLTDGITMIDRCIISGNEAFTGGGVRGYDYPTFTISNSLIIGNQSDHQGGVGVSTFSNNHSNAIINCTIAHNKTINNGSTSSAVAMNGEGSIRNSIVWGNDAIDQLLATCPNVSKCLVQGGYSYNGNTVPGILTVNPQFINPNSALNTPFDGSTNDYHVALFSPVINAGQNSYVQGTYLYDLDSLTRIYDGLVDIGAYEGNYCLLTPTINASGPLSFCQGGSVDLTAVGGNTFLWSNGSTVPMISTSSSGTYTVIVGDTAGCRGQVSATVSALPASVNITGPTVLCQGGSITLTATGNNASYLWSDGQSGATAIFGAAGTYSVQATAANGCVSQDTIIVTLSTPPSPVISLNGQVLQTGNFASFQWYLNGNAIPGATSNSWTPVGNGNYTVTVTNSAGCSGTSSPYTVTTIARLEALPQGYIAVSPNPAHDVLHIQLPSANRGKGQLEIWALDGRRCMLHTIPAGTTVIDLPVSELSKGVYLLKMQLQEGYLVQRIVVQ